MIFGRERLFQHICIYPFSGWSILRSVPISSSGCSDLHLSESSNRPFVFMDTYVMIIVQMLSLDKQGKITHRDALGISKSLKITVTIQ